MAGDVAADMTVPPRIEAATAERWDDLVSVFADCGDARKCWCAFWYLPNREFKAGWGDGNRATLERLVKTGAEPGVIAYVGGEPAGWLSVAPRGNFDRLNRSKSFAPVDGAETWSMNCFVVKRQFRRRGLMRFLIEGGVAFARDRGAMMLEAYPFEANRKAIAGYDLFVGTAAAFRACGFREVARRLPTRPIMRRAL
jgi:GNAT superfamily N-acetyltransferase